MKQEIKVTIKSIIRGGPLAVPAGASGVVIVAHGSGSSRFSPRNIFVAEELQKNGIATLLIDLLTEKEDEVYETRFNIDLLTERLDKVIAWIAENLATKDFAVGLFGASTGVASALRVAARQGANIRAVVSRGGRPDLAMENLGKVISPTLLIVGGSDFGVIELNEQAFAALRCEKKLEIVANATHLFEEPGALEEVARLASDWFRKYLPAK